MALVTPPFVMTSWSGRNRYAGPLSSGLFAPLFPPGPILFPFFGRIQVFLDKNWSPLPTDFFPPTPPTPPQPATDNLYASSAMAVPQSTSATFSGFDELFCAF